MRNPWHVEPVAIATAVRLSLYAAVALGMHLDEKQILAVVAAVEAISMLFLRQTVTAPATLIDAGTTPQQVAAAANAKRAADKAAAAGVEPPVEP